MPERIVSIGHLSEILSLVETVSNSDIDEIDIETIAEAQSRQVHSFRDILTGARRFGWIDNNNSNLTINHDPRTSSEEPRIITLRNMLMQMIKSARPTWAIHLRSGAGRIMEKLHNGEERQLFRDLDLITQDGELLGDQVELWWKEAQEFGWELFNSQRAEEQTRVGRYGEGLSIEYESRRTERRPIQISLIDASAGYDLESIVDNDNSNPIKIEVKATSNHNGSFHISRNEARVCLENPESFFLHVWIILPKRENCLLFILSADEVENHLPQNQGSGQWESVEIPVSHFIDKFHSPLLNSD